MVTKSNLDVFSFCNKGIIVNTVNTQMVMGKGIALEYKLRYPKYFEHYKHSPIKKGGDIDVYDEKIVSFATKERFSLPSKIEWVRKGLIKLKEYMTSNNIKVVTSPYLGCGNGGLKHSDVEKLIVEIFEKSEIKFILALGVEDSEYFKEKLEYILSNIEKVSLPESAKQNLQLNKGKIKLFRDLNRIKGIGNISYKKLLDLEIDKRLSLF